MDEEKQELSEQEAAPKQDEPIKPPWQKTKEGWYDKIPLTLKQLDIIIYVCWALLALFVVGVFLDATGIYDVF